MKQQVEAANAATVVAVDAAVTLPLQQRAVHDAADAAEDAAVDAAVDAAAVVVVVLLEAAKPLH